MSIAIRTTLMCLWLAAWSPVTAADAESGEQRYAVEVILFLQLSGNPQAELEIPQPQPETSRPSEEDFPEPPTPGLRFQNLPASAYTLTGAYERLRLSRGFRPILHTGWVQPGVDAAEAAPKTISGGNGQDGYLSGTAQLHLSRFLHLKLDLTLQDADGSTYALQETRRMRSAEPHYFDHPRFGAIVVIVPYESEAR